MASHYKRTRKDGSLASKFWWIKWRDPDSGKIHRASTKFLVGRGDDFRRLLQLVADKTQAEAKSASPNASVRFDQWVANFLQARYTNELTLSRMQTNWASLRAYLASIQVHSPPQIRREHCLNYLPWRERAGHGNSPNARKISRNTVLLELKTLGTILQEAVNRGFIDFNPGYRLGIERTRPREKSEMTDEHVAIIREWIEHRRKNCRNAEGRKSVHFLHVSFEIALHQGCRMHETHFHLREQVNFERLELTLHAKGGKTYYPPINPVLVPFLKGLIKAGQLMTYEPPDMPSLAWFKVFHALRKKHPDMKNISFHSTRVRAVSRLERGGAPEAVVKKLVNHASTTVHRIYRRVGKDELQPYWKSLDSTASASIPVTPPDTLPPLRARKVSSRRKNGSNGNARLP